MLQLSLQKKQAIRVFGIIERATDQESAEYATHKALHTPAQTHYVSLAPTLTLTNALSPLNIMFFTKEGSVTNFFLINKL